MAPDLPPRYNPSEIEPRWQERWQAEGLYRSKDFDAERQKWYALVMFPYTSGDLHIGHWYAYVPADAHARHRRMKGYNVMFPFGFDAFGLPAENAAITAAIHPSEYTTTNIRRMVSQLKTMGAVFEWDRMLATCDPDYYRWTQWLFIQLFNAGLAYKRMAPVNWCPRDATVLANEQVIDGKCDRCGTVVEKRDLEQWFFKITKYAEELLDFSGMDWPEHVKTMQTNWIGRSEGLELDFSARLTDGSSAPLRVYTTRPDTLFGVTFMALSPEHPLVEQMTIDTQREEVRAYCADARSLTDIDRLSTDREKTGVFTGGYAVNPLNGESVPVWVADYVLMTYGTGAIMGVPAHDERDLAFARRHDLPVRVVITPDGSEHTGEVVEAMVGEGRLVNSGAYSGLAARGEAIAAVNAHVEAEGIGVPTVQYRLRDWLISRQRYWGAPIPIIYCPEHGAVAVPAADLPVLLPEGADFQPGGDSPLARLDSFVNAPCPTCGQPGRRETDTMDTFVDSSWYFLRFTSTGDDAQAFDRAAVDYWAPVDQYMGGIEHAILHLLYARFFVKVLRDAGLLSFDEPFLRLQNQGMIIQGGAKMSKSKGNVIPPDEMVRSHGADAVRMYLMFMGPWQDGGVWSDRGIDGTRRFLNRVHSLVVRRDWRAPVTPGGDAELVALTHRTIRGCGEDIEAFKFNTYVSKLMTLANRVQDLSTTPEATSQAYADALEILLLLLAPCAPHLAEELWEVSGHAFSIHDQRWPEYDPALCVEATFELPIQVDGKVRDRVVLPVGAAEVDVTTAVMGRPKILDALGGQEPRRAIYVPGKIFSIVTR